jgi:hypothetical protein
LCTALQLEQLEIIALDKTLAKNLPSIWQDLCESLACFGYEPIASQNIGLPILWQGKFWKRTKQALVAPDSHRNATFILYYILILRI